MKHKPIKVKPDGKATAMLGQLAHSVSSSSVSTSKKGPSMLEPKLKIPTKEQWLWRNESALSQVHNGLKDSADGRIKSRGDFNDFLDIDD